MEDTVVVTKGTVPVVAVGASAGGVKALKEFTAKIPADGGIVWVIILHLSPDHDSQLAELLQATTPIPVTQVVEQTAIERNHVYVVPPNRSIGITDDALTVRELTRLEQRRAPIDVFLRMLAATHDEQAGCVILSGSGNDGTTGLKSIKEHGGLTVAQVPGEAEYAEMPGNAIATGLVDLVLPVAEMPRRISDYFQGPSGFARRPAGSDENDAAAVREVLAVLRARTGHDFSSYKTGTVRRRIDRRVQLHGLAGVGEYIAFLRSHPDEPQALMKELLISVTSFFRDPASWQVVKQAVIGQLFLNKGVADRIRVWVPACATGEEAYSIAMLLAEHASTIDAPPIQVFGTDLDADAIAVAREGFYTAAEVVDVSEERLRRFFHKEAGGYRIRRELRELLLFAHHNAVRDPPFSHLDLVSCRNFLIYLNKQIQERVLDTFHFALRPGGFLILGSSESPDAAPALFVRTESATSVYQSAMLSTRLPVTVDDRSTASVRFEPPQSVAPKSVAPIMPAELHHRLLEQFGAPSIVVTDEFKVVHISESAGRYLHVPAGEPTRELLQLVRPELLVDLRAALHEAARRRTAVNVRGIPVALDVGTRAVQLSVRPALRDDEPPRGYFLIMFHEDDQPLDQARLQAPQDFTDAQRSAEEELVRIKAHLRATVEQYETQAEESQAANEELQALNEELRSAAEELETSKEELQSVNEELTTVNEELKIKIEELGLTNNDFQNFINATDIGTIFLDRALRVKLFTVQSQAIFNLREGDVGRLLSDITSEVRDAGIHDDVRRVVETLQTVEREVDTRNGHCYVMRVRPYRTTDNRIDGVVMTFHDITARREAELQRQLADERFRLLAESATDYAIFMIGEDGCIESWNPGAQRFFGYVPSEVIGKPLGMLFTPEDRAAGVPELELDTARRTGRAADERDHIRRDGTRFYVSGITTRLGAGGLGFAKIARDLTRQRQSDEALRRAHDDLERRVRERTRDLEAEKSRVTHLLRRVVSAQEDERSRIARDLHDALGQQLTALRLVLERHLEQHASTAHDAEIAKALDLTAAVGDQLEYLAYQLRPPALDDLGLATALPRFVESWSDHVGIDAEFKLAEFESGMLDAEAETMFYRIAQEALNNVAKHAHAGRVDVILSKRDGHALMIVEDDGVGFEPASIHNTTRGIGLLTMRERAMLAGGSLDIESQTGRGTSVFVRVPITGR